jgi:hypothetical protein
LYLASCFFEKGSGIGARNVLSSENGLRQREVFEFGKLGEHYEETIVEVMWEIVLSFRESASPQNRSSLKAAKHRLGDTILSGNYLNFESRSNSLKSSSII